MQEISAGLWAKAAAEGREILQLPPPPALSPEQIQAQFDRLMELRSHFKGPPLTTDEIIKAIERDSHPRDLQRLSPVERHQL
jgi:hypothetical protein